MTLGQPGAVSCLAGATCVDVVMVVPALLSAAGNVMLIVGGQLTGPDLTLSAFRTADSRLVGLIWHKQ